MPELPEVETVVRDLRVALTGRSIVDARLERPSVLRFPDPVTFGSSVAGATVGSVGRRGKYIVIDLVGAVPPGSSGAEAGLSLVIHLGMTGHLDVSHADQAARPHTHLRLCLDDGRQLRFADARRFGRVLLGPRTLLEQSRALPRLGIEPLSPEFTAQALDAVLRRTTRSVKAALLDQAGVAGLGNIYVDEACFAAGVRPSRRCHRLTRAERCRLHAAIVAVLDAAIGNRGSSIDDYRDLWNVPGAHQERLLVYGRAGRPCLRCGRTLRRSVVGGRTTSHCPGCQR